MLALNYRCTIPRQLEAEAILEATRDGRDLETLDFILLKRVAWDAPLSEWDKETWAFLVDRYAWKGTGT